MFGTIRKHQQWLWWIVVVVIIVSFVIYFNPGQSNSGRGGGGTGLGTINGRVITPQQLRDAQQETRLLYFLNFRNWPEKDERASQMGFDLDREAHLRLLRVAKAQEANVHVADSTVGELARRLIGEVPLDKFTKELLLPNGLTADDFERFVRHDAEIQQLSAVVGAAGRLVTPAEAEELYRRDHQELAADVAIFNVSNYMSRVATTNGVLTTWYSNQMARYRTPEMVRVSYMEFPRTNFLAEAEKQFETITNLNLRLEEVYYKAGTNAFKDTNGNILPRDKAIAKIKEDERDKLAFFYARKKASEIGSQLYDEAAKTPENQPLRADLFESIARTNNAAVKVTIPFDIEEGPTNLSVGVNFARVAFSLNSSNNPISFQPLDGEDGYFLIALKDTIPGFNQPYEAVRARVEDDYRHAQAFRMMYQEVGDSLTLGKSLPEVAALAKVPVVTLPPISRSTETLTNLHPMLNLRQLRSVMFSLEPGKTSSFLPAPPDGGYVVRVNARIPIDEAKLKTELPKFTAELRYYKQNEIFNQWFRRQAEKAQATLPGLTPRQTPRS